MVVFTPALFGFDPLVEPALFSGLKPYANPIV
jgi:hypothetical protein